MNVQFHVELGYSYLSWYPRTQTCHVSLWLLRNQCWKVTAALKFEGAIVWHNFPFFFNQNRTKCKWKTKCNEIIDELNVLLLFFTEEFFFISPRLHNTIGVSYTTMMSTRAFHFRTFFSVSRTVKRNAKQWLS